MITEYQQHLFCGEIYGGLKEINQQLKFFCDSVSGMDECKLFYFIAWGLVVGVICLFGLPANCMSLVAFQRDRRVPATTLLQCLAVSDFMLLLTVFVTDSIPYVSKTIMLWGSVYVVYLSEYCIWNQHNMTQPMQHVKDCLFTSSTIHG